MGDAEIDAILSTLDDADHVMDDVDAIIESVDADLMGSMDDANSKENETERESTKDAVETSSAKRAESDDGGERDQKKMESLKSDDAMQSAFEARASALLVREKELDAREMALEKRVRECDNERSRIDARETVVNEALERVAQQEVHLKRWIQELKDAKIALVRAQDQWYQRMGDNVKASPSTGERRTTADSDDHDHDDESGNSSTKKESSSPRRASFTTSATDLFASVPILESEKDSPSSEKKMHMSSVRIKHVSEYLSLVADAAHAVSASIGATVESFDRLSVVCKSMGDHEDDVRLLLGSYSLSSLYRFGGSVQQLRHFLDLMGHSMEQAFTKPLSNLIQVELEDVLTLHMRLLDDRAMLDNATERYLNMPSKRFGYGVGRRTTSAASNFIGSLFGSVSSAASADIGDGRQRRKSPRELAKASISSHEYQWRLRRYDAIASTNRASKLLRLRIAEAAASGLLTLNAWITQSVRAVPNVGAIVPPILTCCQAGGLLVKSEQSVVRVGREQLQAEAEWRRTAEAEAGEEAVVESSSKMSEALESASDKTTTREGWLRLRTRGKGLGPRCWFAITSGGQLTYRKHWREAERVLTDLLLCAVRSCDDMRAPYRFCFEVHMPQRRFCFQATNDDERRAWVATIRAAASSRLSAHSAAKQSKNENAHASSDDATGVAAETTETNDVAPGTVKAGFSPRLSPAESRQEKLERDLKARVIKLNPNCADCRAPNPDWACLNYGVLVCLKCSGVHRSLESAYVRSLSLDTIDATTLRMFEALGGNDAVNRIWEATPQTGWSAPNATAAQKDRCRWIKAKYYWGGFTAQTNESPEEWRERACLAAGSGDVIGLLGLLARGQHVDSKTRGAGGGDASPGEDENADRPKSPLTAARDAGQVLCERLLVMHIEK